MKLLITLLFISSSILFFQEKEPITLHMIGDSTMSVKEDRARPETGWGEPFSYFFDKSVKVINHAKNGRSTRTFIEEGRWETVLEDLGNGDFVFIQFGHNDEVQTKQSSTTPNEFRANLVRYISETKSKGATPILFTPIARRHFNEAGYLTDTHKEFADITREVAQAEHTLFIDLDSITRGYITRLGDERSKLLYLHLEPGKHPNYPNGVKDNTHFSEYGARVMAQLAFAELKKLNTELNNRITKGR